MLPLVLAGSSNVPLATAIAARLGTRPLGRRVSRHPDAELHIVLRESVRDQDVFIVQPTGPPADQHLMELLFLADACRRAGAARITAVMPYFAYARQDRRTDSDVPIGARVVAEIIESVGVDRLMTVDLHTPELEGFFRIPVEHVSAVSVLAEAIRPAVTSDSVLVAPDFGAVRLAERYQRILGCPIAVLRKSRLDRHKASFQGIVGESLQGKSPIIVDDMIATGATIEAAVGGFRAAGCGPDIAVVATHALFVEDALERLEQLKLRQLVVTNSLDRHSLVSLARLVDVAGLLSAAITRVRRAHGEDATLLRA